MTTPTLLSRIMNHEKKCDLTCFDSILLIGSKITEDLLVKLRVSTEYFLMSSIKLIKNSSCESRLKLHL